jgi:putative phosphoesterase
MKIAIISDSHDNVPNIEKALNWINRQGISLLIHCGDLCAPATLTEVILPQFSGQIHLVHGNVGDPELLERVARDLKNVIIHGQVGEIEVNGKAIAFTHFPEKAKELAKSGQYNLVFYGHTHEPWEEKLELRIRNNESKIVRLVNPGTLAGMFYRASFTVYDTEIDKLDLKTLDQLPE